MSINCGNCGNTHPSVAEVKACHGAGQVMTMEEEATTPAERRHSPRAMYAGSPANTNAAPDWVAYPAHPKRVKYAGDLIAKYPTEPLEADTGETMMDIIDGKPVSAAKVDKLITAMQAIRAKVKSGLVIPAWKATVQETDKVCSCGCEKHVHAMTASPAPSSQEAPKTDYAAKVRALKAEVPDGRYAANINGSKIRFFLIKLGKNGFVKISEYASDDLYERRWNEYAGIMEQVIADGIEAAGRRFGDEMGQCRKCGRSLTDEENPYKVFGYGPDCGAKLMG